MYFVPLLIFCLSSVSGQVHPDVLHDESQDYQWRNFVNKKLDNLENLLTAKDEIINQLLGKIQDQRVEMTEIKRNIMSIEHFMIRKDSVFNNFAEQVKNLKNRVFEDQEKGTGISSVNESLSFDSLFPEGLHNSFDNSRFLDKPDDVRSSLDDVRSNPHPNSRSPDVGNEYNYPFHGGLPLDELTPKQNRVPVSPPSQPIAFHAYLSSTVTIGIKAAVVFDQESLDEGNGYAPQDGIYVVPESGTYVFTWTMLCEIRKAFQTQLIVNGVVRGSSYTDSDEINDYHQSMQLVVLEVMNGDHVFIRVGSIFRGAGSTTIKSENTLSHPTFSGWKIL
ncbi:uncharacterized protein LOC132552042 [Ylistrum balloti]|uniref:uncharacterized protein LOC132552042 n=1 Tax=Ylistrum balloti TaxID=509963 RepID=UPI002905CA1D|nr:uncharacterized protein LOC132552042 [Ylistrum balloti]